MTSYSDQPDIMAIGDSMYQGVRSLSFLPAMVQHSAPKQVADAIGMRMTVPDLQRPLLFDLEAEVRTGGVLHIVEHIRASAVENLKAWPLDKPWSQHEAFDNVAIGGAEIASLFQETYANNIDKVRDLSTKLGNPHLPLTELASTIGSLWYALNNCYTLNPRHRDEQKGKSQLDQVEDRQPQILLINIGSNEGLFMAGFAGDFSDATLNRVAQVPELLKPVVERLKKLPERVERIVFNGLIRPRFIPNLMPAPENANDFPGDNYYPMYGPNIGSAQTAIFGSKVKAFDELIADVNARAQSMLKAELGSRVAFADIYTASLQFDGKHHQGRGLAIPGAGKTLNNRPIKPLLFRDDGGFAGLDNMHPTVAGYATIADVVLDALGRSSIRTDKAAAFAADTLLQDIPSVAFEFVEMELSLLGAFGVFRGTGQVQAAPLTV